MFGLFHRPTLGLVLGGGGAKGGAHVGALRVLKATGYEPDIIVGCSIGALVAAQIGYGWSAEQMEQAMCEFGTTVVDCSRPSGLGTTRTERLTNALIGIFGDADLRDLKPRIAVTATDVRTKQRVVINQGPVVKAVLASMAVPGVFEPVFWGDHLLVDGGSSIICQLRQPVRWVRISWSQLT
jgi:NTE family protein